MNLKKLITLLFAGVTAATPLVTSAQNPTILQGNYVSNVFGQANFVLNPNAQTNVANVTLTNATATRSTTTPLVATTEFNVTVTSANGTAAWATRSFDAGMKNQNCEARFSYRGFQATSKAQIKQGANVVAELTLTPSATDPRIASINFPCGDLSAATTFVITDSATLSGTNEIGGIYVGLATNQANVAQAELVGTATFRGGTSCGWSATGTQIAWSSFAASGGSCDWTSTGVVQPQSKLLKFDHVLKPGKYRAILNGTVARTAGNNDSKFVLTDGTNFSGTVGPYYNSTAALQAPFTAELNFEVTSTQSKLIEFKVSQGSTVTSSVIAYNSEYYLQYTLSRFPSSSELVVTPETQNVFASVKLRGSGYSNQVTANAWTKSTSASALTRTTFGKAKVETNNDFSITIDNLPVGSYYVTATGLFGADGTTTSTGYCRFGLADSATGGDQIAAIQQTSHYSANPSKESDASTIGGVYYNSSVGSRTFYLQLRMVSGAAGTFCYNYTDSSMPLTITVIPLDNASNSALYVQGPVKAAATGTAIPAGYVGEKIEASTSSIFNASSTLNVWSNITGLTITLTPGVWEIDGIVGIMQSCYQSNAGFAFTNIAIMSGGSPIQRVAIGSFGDPANTLFYPVKCLTSGGTIRTIVNVTSSTSYEVGVQVGNWSGTPVFTNAVRSDVTPSFIRAVRIN